MHHSLIIFLLGSICGIWQWLAPPQSIRHAQKPESYVWPESFEGNKLTEIPITAVEQEFSKDFPGEIANFRCGNQQVILRYVTRATRKLHSAADCFRASGYHIGSINIHTDSDKNHWSGCEVSKAGIRFFLRERIVAVDDMNTSWTDVSSWYWHALTKPDHGPWLAITVISKLEN